MARSTTAKQHDQQYFLDISMLKCVSKFLASYIHGVTGLYRLMKRNFFFSRLRGNYDVWRVQPPLVDLNMHRPLGTSHSINHVLLAPAHCLYIFLRHANTGISTI